MHYKSKSQAFWATDKINVTLLYLKIINILLKKYYMHLKANCPRNSKWHSNFKKTQVMDQNSQNIFFDHWPENRLAYSMLFFGGSVDNLL